jgi:tetratricopeptide (TPR) repeat protein
LVILFALPFTACAAAAPVTEHQKARRLMAEAQQTSNPIRLFMLALDIHESLDAALAADPESVQIRLDLVRFHTVTPRIAGGSMDEARAQAAEIARRAPPLGHFARGYIAYREKEYGPARIELREAVATARDAATKALALRWLGWLSQESQQWDDAFAAFDELHDLFEIGRTSSFCSCRLNEGKAALREYIRTHPKDAAARKLAKTLGLRQH